MRQVPASDVTPFGIVGNGRVARHFSHYFTLLGLPVSAWSRRARGPSPPEALASCRTILVLISDAEVAPFIDAWPPLQEKRLVHCSGSLVTAAAEGAHPLMTFGPALYDLAQLPSKRLEASLHQLQVTFSGPIVQLNIHYAQERERQVLSMGP